MIRKLHTYWELKNAGATKQEIRELLVLSESLRSLQTAPKLSRHHKKALAATIGFRKEYSMLRLGSGMVYAAIAAVLIVPFALAQKSLPGDTLYNLKKTTNIVRSLVQPGFVDTTRQDSQPASDNSQSTPAPAAQKSEPTKKTDDGKKPEDSTSSNESSVSEESHESGSYSGNGSGSQQNKIEQEHSSDSDELEDESEHKSGGTSPSSNSGSSNVIQQPTTVLISESQARSIAQALYPSKTIKEVELKTDNSVKVYYVKFKENGAEVQVRATDGVVIKP